MGSLSTMPAAPLADLVPAASGWVTRLRDGSSAREWVSGKAPLTLKPGGVLQFEWLQPRDLSTVTLEFTGDAADPVNINLEWWRRIWPDNGTGGWMKLDDPFNGEWTRALTRSSSPTPRCLRLDFAPLGANEAPGIKRTGFTFRRTYKLRISASIPVRLARVSAFSQAVEREAAVRFEWGLGTSVAGHWKPAFEARNGRILGTTRTATNACIVKLHYTDVPDRLSADRGILIFRSGPLRSFAVFIDDVLREGGLYVRDLGVFVSDANLGLTHASWQGPQGEVWKDGTIAEQVFRLPEQSFDQVMKAIPAKPPNELFLGAPNLRQEFALGPKGDVRLYADALRSPGPDSVRRPWNWKELIYRFHSQPPTNLAPVKDTRQVTRTLEEGWLPVVRFEWQQGGIAYTQISFAAPLHIGLAQLQSTKGTEPVVLSTQFQLRNQTSNPLTGALWMELSQPMPLSLEPGGTMRLHRPSEGLPPAGLTPVRGCLNVHGRGRLETYGRPSATTNSPAPQAGEPREQTGTRWIAYHVELAPGQSHAIELHVPYIELLDSAELDSLRSLSFEAGHRSVTQFWQTRVTRGMTYEVPDQFLNEFFKASLWHTLITTDIDPGTGQYQHGAATHHYKNYLNETMMVVRALEMRGEHDEAARLIQTFLDNQGVKGLPGKFKTKAGVLYAAHPTEPDPYTAQGYNMHHGWGLWGAAEHFFWTRDTNYLRRVQPHLEQGFDWVVRERAATRSGGRRGSRAVEYGLPPAGDLEDVEEFLYWYATAAYYHLGMKRAAEALAHLSKSRNSDRPPPAERRLAREVKTFADDIRASVAESVATTPVVRLKDGSWVPYVPPRTHVFTHLSEGWIREGLYPALHLLFGEVYAIDHPYVDWMIQEQEDNIFLSKESGYGVDNQRVNFFHFGGFTLQPNLVDLPIAYLQRDQIPNFLRGFYNTCWASLYPDTMCFAEWVPYYGKGGGPLFKTPDECKFIQWMRAILVFERGRVLELGLGVPRAWMRDGQRLRVERAATLFGELDLEVRSRSATGQITASVRLRPGIPPEAIRLRLRHPEGRTIKSATVNGKSAEVDDARQLVDLPLGQSAWQITAEF